MKKFDVNGDSEYSDLVWELQEVNNSFRSEIYPRIQTEMELDKSFRKFAKLLETVHQFTWTMSLDLKYTFISPSVMHHLGYTPEEFLKLGPLDTLTLDSAELTQSVVSEELEKTKTNPPTVPVSRTFHVQQFHKDGYSKWREVTASFFVDQQGNPLGIIGINRDIDQRKKFEIELISNNELLEQKVRELTSELEKTNEDLRREIFRNEQIAKELIGSEMRCSTIMDVARDLIFTKDAQLRFTSVNRAMCKLFGLPREFIIGKTLHEIRSLKIDDDVTEAEMRVLNGQTIEADYPFTVSGRSYHVNTIKVPIRSSCGLVTGLCGIARDMTDRRELENQQAEELNKYISPKFKNAITDLSVLARSDSTILLLGESGVGKDYLARWVHDNSRRSRRPFFTINCAALTPTLAESELFGHEAGAFTGVKGRKRGLLELAEGGTLLLNELGELDMTIQAKLLYFLDTHKFTRVGGEKEIFVNTRILAATNKNLENSIQDNLFRSDLYFRLNVLSVNIPPLRERLDDIPALAEGLLVLLARKLGLPSRLEIEQSALEKIECYSWPGNIRELKNVLERAAILCEGGVIRAKDIHLMGHKNSLNNRYSETESSKSNHQEASFAETVNNLKIELITKALEKSHGSLSKAAGNLGLTRDQIKHLVKALGIKRNSFT